MFPACILRTVRSKARKRFKAVTYSKLEKSPKACFIICLRSNYESQLLEGFLPRNVFLLKIHPGDFGS